MDDQMGPATVEDALFRDLYVSLERWFTDPEMRAEYERWKEKQGCRTSR